MAHTDAQLTASNYTLEPAVDWAAIHVLLARGLSHPGPAFKDQLADGTYETELRARLDRVDVAPGVDLTPPSVGDRDLGEDYVALFEGFTTPFAPPAESPYKPWYGERKGGLMEGPPASDMDTRFRRLGAAVPDEYPPDHVAVLLEYGSYLLETGGEGQYRAFVIDHLDWTTAFQWLVQDAAADAPFHRWVVDVTVSVLGVIRDRLDVEPISTRERDRMLDRVEARAVPRD